MASNAGKFIDRSPIICAAGKPSDTTETVSACLKRYLLQDEVDALKHEAGVFEEFKPIFRYKLGNTGNLSHRGIYTNVREVLQLPTKTRYQTLINDLKETPYNSYWNKEEGRCCDPTPNLPAGMDPLGTTFGNPCIKVDAGKIINPPKTVYEVLWDSQVGHDLYKKTHDDYNPGEPLNRNYLKPAFNPKKRFGMRTAYDPRGIWARCALQWYNDEPTTSVSNIQADVAERTKSKVGKILAPNNNIACVPKEHRFGTPSNRPVYGVEDLLKDADCPPCLFKREFEDWMRNLNEFRVHLKDLFNASKFDYNDFKAKVLFYDRKYTGWVPLDLFYQICRCNGLNYEHESLEPFFNFTGVIKDGLINYRDFMFLCNLNNSVPEIIKIENVPKKNQYYTSSSKSEACDFVFIDNSRRRTAGIPTYRFDIPKTSVPVGGCRADLNHLGDETAAGAVINPSIYTIYGLSHRDFLMPRSPDVIKKIFEKLGYQFPDDLFEKLWKIGLKFDNTGGVCVDTFKKLLNETVPPSELRVAQTDTC